MDDITAGSGKNPKAFYKKTRASHDYPANGGGRVNGEKI